MCYHLLLFPFSFVSGFGSVMVMHSAAVDEPELRTLRLKKTSLYVYCLLLQLQYYGHILLLILMIPMPYGC